MRVHSTRSTKHSFIVGHSHGTYEAEKPCSVCGTLKRWEKDGHCVCCKRNRDRGYVRIKSKQHSKRPTIDDIVAEIKLKRELEEVYATRD